MTSNPKTVAIVGGGPAGLVSAKHMLQAGLHPCIFDKQPEIGGLWGPNSSAWPSLTTNLSKFTCSFSDWPWNPEAAMFPTKADMGEYLQSYANKFLSDESCFKLRTKVTRVSRVKEEADGWLVEWTDESGEERKDAFDHVIIASGFFAQPYLPVIPGSSTFPGPILHSSQYTSPQHLADKSVAIVGASFSAVEIAAEVATAAKSVTHVVPHSFWLLPRYLPWDPQDPASPFVPLDWVLYRRSRRQLLSSDESSAEIGASRHGWEELHAWFSSVCGDQADTMSPSMAVSDLQPPHVAISDTYASHVRAGKIQVVPGRLKAVQGNTLLLEDDTSLEGLDAVILCTGYRPDLTFLPDDILSTLSYSPNDPFMPLLLHQSVFHPQVPGLAFVGMYRGQYMAAAELQARWVASVFSGTTPVPPDAVQQAGIEAAVQLRALQPRPQFPYPDYIKLADGLAAEVGVLPPVEWRTAQDVVLPAHYGGVEEVRESGVKAWEAAMKEFKAGRAVAGAVFRGLQGTWNMYRDIDSRLPTLPSGTVVGKATFDLTCPNCSEYLYSEEGEFILPNGSRMSVRKKYVYKYSTEQDRIDVHFAPGDSSSKGFFHALKILPGVQGSEYGWRAEGDHLCVKDMYDTSYRFAFKGIQLVKFEIQHLVQGPQKDYTSTTVFTRAQ